jgi:hypothetical protein
VAEWRGEHAIAVVVPAAAGDRRRLAELELRRDLRRGGDVLAVVEDDVPEHVAVTPEQLAVGAGGEPDAGAAAARRPAVVAALGGLVVLPDAALGERARDRRGALARGVVDAAVLERALLHVRDGGEREQADRRDGEHGGEEPRPQRGHHARGVRRA